MTKYDKAIRDKIPEIIKESGGKCEVKILTDEEFLVELDKKLDEELKEYHESKSVEELADIVEVIQKIANLRGSSLKEFEKIQQEKAEKRGKFEKNLFLIESDEKFLVEIEKKLSEEVVEYQKDRKPDELADILEVIYRIAKLRGISKEELEKIRIKKLEERGGFEKNLFLIDTSKD